MVRADAPQPRKTNRSDAEGKLVFETIVATEAAAMIRLLQNLSGPLRVTFEEGTQAAWLYK